MESISTGEQHRELKVHTVDATCLGSRLNDLRVNSTEFPVVSDAVYAFKRNIKQRACVDAERSSQEVQEVGENDVNGT